jgi:phosphate-selective porin OprO and OprP
MSLERARRRVQIGGLMLSSVATLALAQQAPTVATPPEAPDAVAAKAVSSEPAGVKPAAPKPSGFWIEGKDGSFKLRLSGYIQGDGRFYAGAGATNFTGTFLLRRAYSVAQGDLGRYFSFYVATDFGAGKASLDDGYFDLKLSPAARIRVGKTKSPVGLEALQSSSNTLFVERALPSSVAPNRDIGVMLHGEPAGGVVAYALGVFDGTLDGTSLDQDANKGKEGVARLFVRPLKKRGSALDLGFGVAASYGRNDGALTTYKTPGQQSLFSYVSGASAEKNRRRIAPQGYAYYRFLGAMAEWTRSLQDGVKGATHVTLKNTVWSVAGSIVLTGEKASYNGVKPRHAFDPAAHAYGAVELAARYGALRFGDDAFSAGFVDASKSPREARALGLGINWYLSENVKYQLNLEHTKFEGGATAGANRPAENAVLFRAQVSF